MFVCVCVVVVVECVYVHPCMCTCVHTYMHTCVHICNVYTRTYMYVCMYVQMALSALEVSWSTKLPVVNCHLIECIHSPTATGWREWISSAECCSSVYSVDGVWTQFV